MAVGTALGTTGFSTGVLGSVAAGVEEETGGDNTAGGSTATLFEAMD